MKEDIQNPHGRFEAPSIYYVSMTKNIKIRQRWSVTNKEFEIFLSQKYPDFRISSSIHAKLLNV